MCVCDKSACFCPPQRDELDLQLALRNKERVGLELQLKVKAKELGKLEHGLEAQTQEVDDLVFALEVRCSTSAQPHEGPRGRHRGATTEGPPPPPPPLPLISPSVLFCQASNTENKYLHDEIARLKRKSRQSLGELTDADRDPKTFMKQQVVSALSSYQTVRKRNEDKEADHAVLRRQMIESQSDPSKVIESLATNMGFWLLGQAGAVPPSPLPGLPAASRNGSLAEGEAGGGAKGGAEGGDELAETLGALAAAQYASALEAHEEAEWAGTAEGGNPMASAKDQILAGLKGALKGRGESQVAQLKEMLEASNREKALMEAQLKLTESKVDDLSSNLMEYSHVRLELEEQLAAQQMLLQVGSPGLGLGSADAPPSLQPPHHFCPASPPAALVHLCFELPCRPPHAPLLSVLHCGCCCDVSRARCG